MQPGWEMLEVLSLILTGKPTGKRPLGNPKHRWVDDIGINLNKRREYGKID